MIINEKGKWVLILLTLAGGVFLLAGCSAESSIARESQPAAYEVEVIEVPDEPIPISYVTTGSVVSDARVQVSSRIMGFICKIAVREGEKVAKGQLLATLDDADVEGAIRQVHASMAKARAALRDSETDVQRYETLFARGSTSENSLRKIRLQRDVAENSYREVKAALQVAKAQRNYISITSPVNGVVVDRLKRKGDLATPGAPILTVESTVTLLFETYVAETRIGGIQVGDPVLVFIDALENPLEAAVTRVVPSGDPVTRRYRVKVALPDVPKLMPGMFGRCRFIIGSERSPVVPRSALVTRGGLVGVYIVNEKHDARFRWLRTAREWPDRLQVKAGLKGGESIVATVPPRLRDGDMVKKKRD